MTVTNDDFEARFSEPRNRIPEDTIHYSLFVIPSNASDARAMVKDQLGKAQAVAKQLESDFLQGYIWQREGFKLDFRQENDLLSLHGATNFGDSIEDEWLIVYLLRELSKRFHDLWIRAVDSDGEFLLVEAANALPRWLNPEVADNRVWIHNGSLHIIQPSDSSGPDRPKSTKGRSLQPLTITDALAYITTQPENLMRSSVLELEAFYRLRNYPDQIKKNLHQAVLPVPRKLATILNLKPELISPAVEAFYLRDPISLRPLQGDSPNSLPSQLAFPPADFVSVSIKFPKVAYAQIKSQRFSPPQAWTAVLAKELDVESRERMEVGMKVTCGFEMLVSDPQNQGKGSVLYIRQILQSMEKGEISLPSNAEIAQWDKEQDDESWLDIDFEDLEQELSGSSKTEENGKRAAFGDKTAQENLRKMVERFEAFLNDDTTGPEGASGWDEVDEDDDETDDEDEDDEGEDRDASFDEEQFAQMMREMMGLPSEDADEPGGRESGTKGKNTSRVKELPSDLDDEEDDEDIRDVMKQVETELKEAGALDLDSSSKEPRAAKKADHAGKRKEEAGQSNGEGHSDLDYNLARNLLESFKGQAGTAGPAGTMIGSLGLRFPRDEEEDHNE